MANVLMLLDASLSMQRMGTEPVDSVNEFMHDQVGVEARITLATFNSVIDFVLDDHALHETIRFDEYRPNGRTALHDAVCEGILRKLKGSANRDVVCVIITDGLENASQKFDEEDTKRLIESTQTEFGWRFIYLAANQDASTSGRRLGIRECANFLPTRPGNLLALTRQTSSAILRRRPLSTSTTVLPGLVLQRCTSRAL